MNQLLIFQRVAFVLFYDSKKLLNKALRMEKLGSFYILVDAPIHFGVGLFKATEDEGLKLTF